MAHDVFLSYASEDQGPAWAVVATLEARGIRCWIAPRDVVPGSEYGAAIVEAIDTARVAVVVFSRATNRSHHVRREVERAASRGIAVVPLRLEDVPFEPALAYFLSSTHRLDALPPPFEAHLDRVVEAVTILLSPPRVAPATARSSPAAPARPAPPADLGRRPGAAGSPRSRERGRWLLPAVALGVLLLLVVLLRMGCAGH